LHENLGLNLSNLTGLIELTGNDLKEEKLILDQLEADERPYKSLKRHYDNLTVFHNTLLEAEHDLSLFMKGEPVPLKEQDEKGTRLIEYSVKGRQYMYISIAPHDEETFDRGTFGPWCQHLCGKKFVRPHFSCSTGKCWIQKLAKGKIPPVVEIQNLQFKMRVNRAWWKRRLWRNATSIYELVIS